MKKERCFFKINNKGLSLVTVIITIGFISILAGVVMMTSLINYKMKNMNAYAKDTFYSAEQVLDEINIGLQKTISDSLSLAYADVMRNYSEYPIEKKRSLVQTTYYENMWKYLQAGNSNKKYDVKVLEGFLKETTRWPEDLENPEEGYGAIVRAGISEDSLKMTGEMITYDNGIILKDLRVYYKDSKGFVSIINTDIRLTYPELDFATTTTLPDIASYGVIADAGISTEGVTALELEGNFFMDSFMVSGKDKDGRKQIVHQYGDKFVVKHKMQLKNASFVNTGAATLWAEDIETIGGTLALEGQTYVADDLNVNGKASEVTLKGIYNGFGTSLDDASESSAILINGTDSKVDMSKIEMLTLGGHAYIGTADENTEPAEEKKNTENVYTGETIAVKSNQLMYLIPPECIGVKTEDGLSEYFKNPLTETEYKTITDVSGKYIEVSLDVKVNKLGGATLREYMAQTNGVARPKVVFVQVPGGENLVYYYMNFINEDTANRYFEKYYTGNKETYADYLKRYVSEIKFPLTATGTRVKLAANGVHGTSENGFGFLPYTMEGASTKLADNRKQYQERFSALCTKLTDNLTELVNLEKAPDKTGQILFDNIVDHEKLKDYITKAAGVSAARHEIEGADGTAVLTTENEYTVTDKNVHLVIADGNVTISVPEYTGTVFANGKVTIADNVRLIREDNKTVNAMLRYYELIDDKNVMIAQVLHEGDAYMFVAEDAEETDRTVTSMSDLIVYENWRKE